MTLTTAAFKAHVALPPLEANAGGPVETKRLSQLHEALRKGDSVVSEVRTNDDSVFITQKGAKM